MVAADELAAAVAAAPVGVAGIEAVEGEACNAPTRPLHAATCRADPLQNDDPIEGDDLSRLTTIGASRLPSRDASVRRYHRRSMCSAAADATRLMMTPHRRPMPKSEQSACCCLSLSAVLTRSLRCRIVVEAIVEVVGSEASWHRT